MELYSEIIARLADNRPVALETVVNGTEGGIALCIRRSLKEVSTRLDAKGRRVADVEIGRSGDTLTISEPMLPQERLIILGGGHIAQPLCTFGVLCGWDVWVVDDRPDFAAAERFPGASRVICAAYPDGIAQVGVTPFDYVVIITHGHKFDGDCLRAIIPGTMPAYLGMIGSRTRVGAQMEMLRQQGLSPERLAKVCTPIGLNIGAVTPGEIAAAIIAEVISHRRLAEFTDESHFLNRSDVELSVLRFLAGRKTPAAVATVIETDGSSPRGAGAKMVIDPSGAVTGSVGGGIGELAVIKEGLALIGKGRYKLMELDLTGGVDQSSIMACGGRITVLVEDAAV